MRPNKFPIQKLQKNNFPELLLQIPHPPQQLFYRGNISLLYEPLLAIVGSRTMTSYGSRLLEKWIPQLTKHLTIVSGLAFGVDAQAHTQTLKYNGSTIAVIPGGIDDESIVPRLHVQLAHRILQNNGLIISEESPGSKVYKSSYAKRNRIIAGLCKATLIMEAAYKSGSLITAFHALNYNRELCTVPADIGRTVSQGTNYLLKKGAHVITESQDILHLYGITTSQELNTFHPENKAQQHILSCIEHQPCAIDTIIKSCTIHTKDIPIQLSLLELKGIIKIEAGKVFKV